MAPLILRCFALSLFGCKSVGKLTFRFSFGICVGNPVHNMTLDHSAKKGTHLNILLTGGKMFYLQPTNDAGTATARMRSFFFFEETINLHFMILLFLFSFYFLTNAFFWYSSTFNPLGSFSRTPIFSQEHMNCACSKKCFLKRLSKSHITVRIKWLFSYWG